MHYRLRGLHINTSVHSDHDNEVTLTTIAAVRADEQFTPGR